MLMKPAVLICVAHSGWAMRWQHICPQSGMSNKSSVPPVEAVPLAPTIPFFRANVLYNNNGTLAQHRFTLVAINWHNCPIMYEHIMNRGTYFDNAALKKWALSSQKFGTLHISYLCFPQQNITMYGYSRTQRGPSYILPPPHTHTHLLESATSLMVRCA